MVTVQIGEKSMTRDGSTFKKLRSSQTHSSQDELSSDDGEVGGDHTAAGGDIPELSPEENDDDTDNQDEETATGSVGRDVPRRSGRRAQRPQWTNDYRM